MNVCFWKIEKKQKKVIKKIPSHNIHFNFTVFIYPFSSQDEKFLALFVSRESVINWLHNHSLYYAALMFLYILGKVKSICLSAPSSENIKRAMN